MRLIQITDLHLSDRPDTPAADALGWAIDTCNAIAPDLVAFTGDMTTYGTSGAAAHFLKQAGRLNAPWTFTPGNAELRSEGAMPLLAECGTQKQLVVNNLCFLLPDTSTGRLRSADRNLLNTHSHPDLPHIILTHYPMDTLESESRVWLEAWLADHPVELYLAGHRHFTRSRQIGACLEVITRGLDPDKAFGGPPGISLFERSADGVWSEEEIPWPHGLETRPAETDHSPLGWSIHGDPIETARETFNSELHVMELRPRGPDYDIRVLREEVERLRNDRPIYLSWHLPSLSWDPATESVTGLVDVATQVDHAIACGVNALTVHVPQVGAHLMEPGNTAWLSFLDAYRALFKSTGDCGVRLSIENIHNNPGTPVDREHRKFATSIDEFETWIDSVIAEIGSDTFKIGAHFDVGHARNNGELGNIQPIGDWYARIGRRITGYHIHQVRPHEETGKLTNHRDIKSIYDRTISYAGFLHAWSTRLINRAPLFVEVRDAEERRRTAQLLSELFS